MGKLDPVVCIVGAGPAGLALAHLLRRANITFVILERQDAERHRALTKAGMIEPRTVKLLRSHGLADTILKGAVRNGVCEFRADGKAFILDYGRLTNGSGHYVYPQQRLVDDWAEELDAAGAECRFGVRVTAIEQDAHGATVTAIVEATEQRTTLSSEIVAVCTGAGSEPTIGRASIATVELSYPVRWIAVIASVLPTSQYTIYGLHRRGFAGQMRRSATMTRYYLEVPRADSLDDWPDDRVWAELQERLGVAGRPSLVQGRLVERDILDLRVFVREPMQHGRVFLVGDAAHLVTPAGAKGMNMAIQDAVELAAGLRDRYAGAGGTGDRLAHYSATRLPAVWQYEEFSNFMFSLLHADCEPTGQTPALRVDPQQGLGFANRLRWARLDRVLNDPDFSRWFSRAYCGVDE
jgi:p-hydroxybenzoate 3-monooxygenase